MRKLKLFLSMLMLIAFSVGNVWAVDYELVYTLDCVSASSNGSQQAYGVNATTVMAGSGVKAFLNAAVGTTLVSTDATVSGSVYWTKGQGGGNIPNDVLKLGKASGPGSISFTIGGDDDVTKVEISGYGWKNTTAVSVNSSTSQTTTTAQDQLYTFSYEIDATKTISISVTSSAFCATEIKLYKTKSGGTPTPSLSVAPTSINFGTVEKGTSVSSEAVAVTFANLTGTVTYSGLSSPFTASGAVSATGDEITIAANTSNVGEYEQTLTVQSTADALSKTVTVTMNVVEPFDGLALTFPDYNDKSVSSYTSSWTATKSGQVWTIDNFNNNSNGWSLIKAGRNGNASVASITTQVEDHAVSDVTVTIDGVTASKINSHKLYVADNSSFTGAIEITGAPSTMAAGNIVYTVPVVNRANDLYYKLEFNCASGSSNGFLQISKITYAYAAATPQKDPAGLAYDDEDLSNLVKLGDAFTAPTLTNPHSLSVAYTSSNTDVAEVNASTGALNIKAVGIAEITASSEETDTYKAGSASYTIYVATEAGTAAEPLTETSAKALIDAGCTMNVYVKGTVNSVGALNTQYGSITLDLAAGFRFYAMLNEGGVQFTENPFVVGDVVTAVGDLKKHQNTTYELDMNCVLVERIAYTTPKTHIVSDIDNPITVAAAIGYIDDPVTYDLTDDVWVRGVVTNVGQTNGASPVPYIDVKDANAENSFRFYNYTVNSSITEDPQQYDILIATGKLDKHNTTYELNGCEVVDLVRPDVAVESVELDQNAASIEVGETVSLTATVNPNNASNKAITWSVQSGSEYATVDAGVVTGILAGGTAVIRAAATADPTKYAECTVTVVAADPTKHVVTFDATVDMGESPLSKSNISMACTSGALNNGSEYRLYKSSTTTFACSDGNITKIEFTGVSGNPVSGFGDPEVGTLVTEGNNGVWTGNAESVSFVASGAQVRATEIVVTYKEDNRAAAGLTWSTDAVELTVGDEFTAPTLNNPNSIAAGEITIASNNTDLATVNAGVVSLVAEATGTATITATFEGNEDYKPAVVSYTITVNEAGLDNVTFDATEDIAGTNELSITKSGFTLAFTDGALGNGENYRLYKNQTMTLSSSDYLIKKIEFTCTSGYPISGFADATGLDKDNNEWTGESNTVELTASNAQVRMTKIKVFYVDDTRAAAGLAWNPADNIELTVGGAFSAPALYNPNNIAENLISITSSNESVATVSEGEVSLVADATGTTTITATFAGNDDYKPATVSYKITVNPAYSIYVTPSLNVNFGSVEQDAVVADKKVTVTFTNVPAATLTLEGAGASAFTISPAAAMTASGDITISASSANLGTFAATLTISDDDNNAESKVVNLSITVNEPVIAETPVSTSSKWVPATEIADGMQVLITGVKSESTYAMGASSSNGNNRTSVAGSFGAEDGAFVPGEGTMSFTLVATGAANTYYIKTSNNQYLYNASSITKSYLKTKAEQEDVSWTIELDGDNNAVITSVENTNRQIMRFNTNGGNDPLFNCYASGQTAIKLYVPKPAPAPDYGSYQRNVTAGNYGTICLPKAGVISGATLYEIGSFENNMIYVDEILSGEMVAGKPYIFQATADQLNVTYTSSAVEETAGHANGLYGFYNLNDEDAQKNLDQNDGNYILYQNAYWLVSGRAAYIANYRAYIKIGAIQSKAAAPGRRRVAMTVNCEQVATGMESIQPSEVSIQKVMIDGKLFIIRGEKMYNVNGQVVK